MYKEHGQTSSSHRGAVPLQRPAGVPLVAPHLPRHVEWCNLTHPKYGDGTANVVLTTNQLTPDARSADYTTRNVTNQSVWMTYS